MSSALPNGPAPDILRVIGNDVPLHVKTKHELAGPCPFCGTGRDRFIVNTDRQRWWCRQCSGTDHWSDAYEYIQKRDRITFTEAKAKLDGVQLPPAPKPLPRLASDTPPGPVIAAYDYRDESGTLLYQKLRHEPKTFSFQRPDNEGGWIKNLTATRRVLYRLGDLLARPQATVFVCEGEKDADTVAGLGLLATADDQGAQTNFKWNRELAELLRGRHVVLLPDKDVVGLARCAAITEALKDIALSCITLELPGDGKDATDWKDAGGTRPQLEELVKAARLGPPNPRILSLPDLMRKTFNEPLAPVPGIIVEGCTLFGGKPKSGKSWAMLHLSLAVANGGYAFGKIKCPGGDVLHLSLEDGERLLQVRYQKLLGTGALPGRLSVASSWASLSDGGLGDVEAWLKAHPKAHMVVIDTLTRVREDDPKQSLYRQDYNAVAPWSDLAHRYRVAIVLVTHTRKGEAADVMDTFNATLGLTAAADNLIVLERVRFSNEGKLGITGREILEDQITLEWDKELAQWTHTGHGEEAIMRSTQDRILEVLDDADEPMYPRDIAGAAGLDTPVVTQRLFHMAKAGLVKKQGYGKYAGYGRNSRNSRNSYSGSPPENRNSDVIPPVRVGDDQPPEDDGFDF